MHDKIKARRAKSLENEGQKNGGNLSSGARGKGRIGGTYSCGCPPAPSPVSKFFLILFWSCEVSEVLVLIQQPYNRYGVGLFEVSVFREVNTT